MICTLFLRHRLLTFLEMGKEYGRDLVSLVRNVKLQLVQTVGVVITRVTAKLNRVGNIQKLQLPFITGTTLLDVIHVVKTLQMLVCLAMKLEIGLQIGLVAAEFADEVSSNDNRHLILSVSCSVLSQVLGEEFQIVTTQNLCKHNS